MRRETVALVLPSFCWQAVQADRDIYDLLVSWLSARGIGFIATWATRSTTCFRGRILCARQPPAEYGAFRCSRTISIDIIEQMTRGPHRSGGPWREALCSGHPGNTGPAG